MSLIIRSNTLVGWVNANLKENLPDIAEYGCTAGFPMISYYTDTNKLYDRFADEIWGMLDEDAEELGEKNILTMIAGFGGADAVQDEITFKNLLLWYAVERIAHKAMDEDHR